MAEIQVNGKLMPLDGVRTIGDLLRARGIKAGLVAVEHNGVIVPRAEFDQRTIEPGDKLEIVHFVGGG